MPQGNKKLRGFATGIWLGFVLIYDKKKIKSQRASEQRTVGDGQLFRVAGTTDIYCLIFGTEGRWENW